MAVGGHVVALKSGTRFVLNTSRPGTTGLILLIGCKVEDFEKIGKIWLQVCAKIAEEFEQGLLEEN